MGYKLVAGGMVEDVTDAVWLDILTRASEQGFSAPHLRLESLYESTTLTPADARALEDALGPALKHVEDLVTAGDRLDRATVHRVRHVLRSGEVRLSRTPRWMAGDP